MQRRFPEHASNIELHKGFRQQRVLSLSLSLTLGYPSLALPSYLRTHAARSIVFSEVRGAINCRTKLSGMPDLLLSFVNPRVLDDPSFHPCVRLTEWTNSRVLSFIPPDGFFVLANYIIGPETPLAIPLNVRPNITFDEGTCQMHVHAALLKRGRPRTHSAPLLVLCELC